MLEMEKKKNLNGKEGKKFFIFLAVVVVSMKKRSNGDGNVEKKSFDEEQEIVTAEKCKS